MKYKVIYSRRRSCAVQIRDGEVILRLPLGSGKHIEEEMLAKHNDWIRRKLEEADENNRKFPLRKVEYGEHFPLWDGLYELKCGQWGFEGAFLIPEKYSPVMAEALRKLYRETAAAMLPAKVAAYTEILKWRYGKVDISNALGRWGSCAANGNIKLSWRLMLLPEFLADYVIFHELAHLQELNHSPKFYQVLCEVFPEWQKAELELKTYKIRLDNWI